VPAITVSAEPTDEELARARSIRELYDRHARPLFAYACALLRDRALAEDVLQETFVKVHTKIAEWDARRAFKPWLYRISRNVALDALRSKKKEARLARGAPRKDAPSAEEDAQRSEEEQATRAALDALPDEMRALLLQRHEARLTIPELADVWGVSERTIVTRLREASGLLAQALALGSRRGGGP